MSPFPLSMSSLTDFRRLFFLCTPPFFAHFQSRLFPRDYAGVDRREETRRNVHFPLAKLGQCQLPSEEKRGAGEKTAGEKRSSGNTGVRGRTPDRGQAKERRGDRNGRDRSNQRSGSGQPGRADSLSLLLLCHFTSSSTFLGKREEIWVHQF